VNQLRPAVRFYFSPILTFLAMLAATLSLPVSSYAFGTNPPLPNAGAPGQGTCASCHGSLTAGSGITVNAPGTYTPGGAAVSMTVSIPSTGGYELEVGTQTNNTQAGSLSAGTNSNVSTSGALQFVFSSAESTTFTFNWTPPATNVGAVEIWVTGGTLGSNFSNTYIMTPAAAATPDFILTASPTSVSIAQGASGTSTMTATPKNGFTGTVSYAATGLPSGVTASFAGSVMTLAASSSAAAGTSTVTITGTSGTLSHTATVGLTVTAAAPAPNFSLSANPISLTVAAGASGTSAMTVTPSGGFTGTVTYAASGTPSGVTATFSANTLTLAASSSAAAGTSTVTITGTSGTLSHTATVSLTVTASAPAPNFSLSSNPASLTVAPGAAGMSTISVTPTGGFTGALTYTASGVPSGVTASFTANTLTLSASSSAAAGTSTVTITGTSGSLSHTTTVSLTVSSTTVSPTISATPSTLSFNYVTGGKVPAVQTVSVTSTGGSTSYTATETDPWLSISPKSGTSTPASITATVNPAGMSAGSYGAQINITSAGGKTFTVSVSLTITSTSGGGGGGTGSMYARPYVSESQSGTLASAWMDNMGTSHDTNDTRNRGLVIGHGASAPTNSWAGASIQNVTGISLTEVGFDSNSGIPCVNGGSVHFDIITTGGTAHTLGGCTSTLTTNQSTAPTGWTRLEFDPSKATPPISAADHVQSISIELDKGSIAVIDNITVNGVTVGKGYSTSGSTSHDE